MIILNLNFPYDNYQPMGDSQKTKKELLAEIRQLKKELANLKTQNKDRERMDQALRESEAFNFALFNYNPVQTIVVDRQGRVIRSNIAKRQSGDRIPNIGDVMYKDYASHHSIDMYAHLMDCIQSGKTKRYPELKYKDKILSITIASFPGGGIITSQDLSDLCDIESQLKQSLKDKDALLKEVHQRVKGNLQVISSLLSLQSKMIKDAKMLAVFKESQNRLETISLIHEKLFHSDNLAQINYAEYIKSLAEKLSKSYQVEPTRVQFRMELEELFLEIGPAIPCSLIVNELISNSLVHAFPENREGEITIELASRKTGEFELAVRDNGVGVPSGFDLFKVKSLGLQLVSMLVDQMNARMEFVSDGEGVEFRLIFPTTHSGKE